jgi:hemoglobin-like flavoprotein
MSPESIARVQASYAHLTRDLRALSTRFYQEMFDAAPALRPLFPADLTSLQGHFESALALVVRNLHEMGALQQALRDLGAQHVHWGARPGDYLIAREALVSALRANAPQWDATLEADWRRAVTDIVIPMLEGAAVEHALAAEKLASENTP